MDIVVANVTVEIGELAYAVSTNPKGFEGLGFDKPSNADRNRETAVEIHQIRRP